MKRITIFAMVTVFAAVMLCSCAGTENGAEVQTTSEVTTTTDTEEVATLTETTTTTATEATTAVTEAMNDTDALISEYLDYFEKNKDKILTDDTEKYRLSFFQAADRQTGMMVEISSGEESTVKRRYYSKSEKRIEELSWGYQPPAHSDETREYSTWLLYDAEGAYYERTLCEIKYADGSGENIESILKEGEEQGAIGNTRFIYYAHTIDNLDKLFEAKFGKYEYREDEPPIDWSESYNKDTERYEFYVLSVNIIKADGEVDVLNNPIWFPILYSRVSKDDFTSAWDEFTADLTDVTDCVKYSSEWMNTDDELDKAEIIKGACEALSAKNKTTVTEVMNDPEALIGEYLDYFENNKDKILTDDTEKYRLCVFQRNSSDVPGLMVETSSGTENSVKRKYYGKFDKWIGEIPWHTESTAAQGETREYSSVLCVDSKGNYCEIVTLHQMYEDGTGRIVNSIYPNRGDIIQYSRVVYYSDSLEKLSKSLSAWFVIPVNGELTDLDLPRDWAEQLKNPQTGNYEFYIYFLGLINAIGDVEYIDSANAPLCSVSKETYYSRWDEFTSDLMNVTDCVKYSSEWMDTDDELDKAEIIKGVFENLGSP